MKSGGFQRKLVSPKLEVVHDTLTGTLHYADTLVAVGTMNYKHENLIHGKPEHLEMGDVDAIKTRLGKTQINLKLIPSVDGKSMDVAQLIAYEMIDAEVKGAWGGHARAST